MKTTEQKILQKIQEVYREVIGDECVTLHLDSKLDETLGLSSFALIQLVYAIEEAFQITVSNRALRSFRTVRDVVHYIQMEVK